MTRLLPSIVTIVVLAAGTPRLAAGQANAPASRSDESTPSVTSGGTEQAQPPAPAPSTPPAGQPAMGAEQQPQSPPGQWVYTQQYGWVFMPYGDTYTYAPTDAAQPYMYVYEPALGWTWLAAPWIWGWGPWPYFGAYGPYRFGWYAHGPGYGHAWYGGWTGYGYRGGWYGHAPGRPAYGGMHGVAPAPPYRGAPGRPGGATAAPGRAVSGGSHAVGGGHGGRR